MIESLAEHAGNCDCESKLASDKFLPFEAKQMHQVGQSWNPYVSFSFDGKIATLTLDKVFIMPNLETLVEVLLKIAYEDSWGSIQMVSGDEISVGELFANDTVDEIVIDDATWRDGKPCYEAIDNYAFAGDNYVIIGGSGSPGADDSGWSAVCQLGSRMWIYASDPGRWQDLGDITREEALAYFQNDNEYLRSHPEQYEYSEWFKPTS
jgi:hypothetical protein